MNHDQKLNTKKIILTVVKAVGVLGMALVAPNALRMFKVLDQKDKKYNPKYYLSKRVQDLIDKGLLKEFNQDGIAKVTLTPSGERLLRKYSLKERNIGKKKWDGKWRVFTFDVWENNRRKRDLLRSEIRNFGFIQLQKSVWIYPYECGEFIELLKSDLNFGKNVRYMVVEELDNDLALRKHFNLNT